MKWYYDRVLMILTKYGVIGYPHMWVQGYMDTRICEYMLYGYMDLKMVHISDISNPFPNLFLLRDSTLHMGPLFDSKSESELSKSSAEMYGGSEQSGSSLRYIASERYGVSERSEALESSGASI